MKMKFITMFIYTTVYLIIIIDTTTLAHSVRGHIVSTTGVLVTAEYDDGESMNYAETNVFCCGEKLPFQSGRTDRNGRFLFLPDKPGIWEVIIKDELGHQIKLKASFDSDNAILEVKNNQLQSCSNFQKALTGIAIISFIFSLLFCWKSNKTP